jgi:hypothetical protein
VYLYILIVFIHFIIIIFDTTTSNKDKFYGISYSLLERKLERDILFFVCRHNINEIILSMVFKMFKVNPMFGPNIWLFKRFKSQGNTLKKKKKN